MATPTKSKLADLFKKGEDCTISDGENEVTVYISKLSPHEMDQALRRANSVKAKWLALRYSDSDERYAVRTDISDFVQSKDNMIDFLALNAVSEASQAILAEAAADEQWSDDDYLVGLNDQWNEGLKERYLEDENDEEAKKVWDELKRFDETVGDKSRERLEREKRDLSHLSEAELYEKVVDEIIDIEANQVWLTELRLCQLQFAVRDTNNHRKYVFASREEVDSLDPEAQKQLLQAFERISVSVTEGKSSQEAQPS